MGKKQDDIDDELWLAKIRESKSDFSSVSYRRLAPDPWLDGPEPGAIDAPSQSRAPSPPQYPSGSWTPAEQNAAPADPWAHVGGPPEPQRGQPEPPSQRPAPERTQPEQPRRQQEPPSAQQEPPSGQWAPHTPPPPVGMPRVGPRAQSPQMPVVPGPREPMPIPRIEDPWAPQPPRRQDGAQQIGYDIPRLHSEQSGPDAAGVDSSGSAAGSSADSDSELTSGGRHAMPESVQTATPDVSTPSPQGTRSVDDHGAVEDHGMVGDRGGRAVDDLHVGRAVEVHGAVGDHGVVGDHGGRAVDDLHVGRAVEVHGAVGDHGVVGDHGDRAVDDQLGDRSGHDHQEAATDPDAGAEAERRPADHGPVPLRQAWDGTPANQRSGEQVAALPPMPPLQPQGPPTLPPQQGPDGGTPHDPHARDLPSHGPGDPGLPPDAGDTRDVVSRQGPAGASQPRHSTGFQSSEPAGFQPSESTGFQPSEPAGFQSPEPAGFQSPESTGFQSPESTGFQSSESTGFQPPQRPQTGAFAVPPQSSGGVPAQLGGQHALPPSIMPLDLSDSALVKQRKDAPEAGWRRALYKASFGGINPGISREQAEKNALIERIRTPIRGCHKIAVVSLKGGIGKTTTTSCLGLTLAHYRGDRVVALDANPDAGTLAERLTGVTDVSVRNMLDNMDDIRSFTDISRYMSLASRLQVLASDQDAEVSEAFDADQYKRITDLLAQYYNVILTDSGTGMLHSAMRGTLEEADSLVVVGAPSVDGSSRAAKTLDWLVAHGYGELVAGSVAVISSVREKSNSVDMDVLRNHFGSRCRSVIEIPYDPHLVIGGRIDMSQISPQTERAYLGLAATVADGFRVPAGGTRPGPAGY